MSEEVAKAIDAYYHDKIDHQTAFNTVMNSSLTPEQKYDHLLLVTLIKKVKEGK